MNKNKLFKTLGIGMMVFFSFVLVACGGRDISTVEEAIEGHWTATDARVNGQPLEEAIQEYDEILDFDSEEITGSEDEEEVDADFYYDEDTVTIINGEGNQTVAPYEVINTDEDNNTITLEYFVEDEEVDIKMSQMITFSDEEREVLSSTVDIVDVEFKEGEDEEERSELEEEFYQMGLEMAADILREIDMEIDLEYVDDQEAPAEE